MASKKVLFRIAAVLKVTFSRCCQNVELTSAAATIVHNNANTIYEQLNSFTLHLNERFAYSAIPLSNTIIHIYQVRELTSAYWK